AAHREHAQLLRAVLLEVDHLRFGAQLGQGADGDLHLAAGGGATGIAASGSLSGRCAFYRLTMIRGLYGVRVAEGTRQPLLSDAAGVAVLLLGSLVVTMLLLRFIRQEK
ncbi:MAG: hypothetical protein ACK59B_10060, partial [Alphaproteobacteria bacterium]